MLARSMIMTSEIKEIKTLYKGLQTLYDIYLPKVDPSLIDDMLMQATKKEFKCGTILHGRTI